MAPFPQKNLTPAPPGPCPAVGRFMSTGKDRQWTVETPCVLAVNKHYRPVEVKTPREAFGKMASGMACGLHIALHPETGKPDVWEVLDWDGWLRLPAAADSLAIRTAHRMVRIPVILLDREYDQVQERRVPLTLKNLFRRDGGRCQYTGRLISLAEASMDHYIPSSRGGRTVWENVLLACREINGRKGNMLPEEAARKGIRALKKPHMPRVERPEDWIVNHLGIPEWGLFLPKAA